MLKKTYWIVVFSIAQQGLCNHKAEITDPPQIEITRLHVSSTIQFRFARTEVVSHIKNHGTVADKSDFTMVIPDSAFISNFSMIIREVEYVAEVMKKEEAKNKFDNAINRKARIAKRTAGIVSKETRDANIFTAASNIEPGQTVVFKLIYEELLERKFGMYRHVINIDPLQVVDDLRIQVFINESLPISKISVPELVQSNEIDFDEHGENKVVEVTPDVDGCRNNAKVLFAPDTSYQKEASSQGISGQLIVKYDLERTGYENEVQVIGGFFIHTFVPENLEILQKHMIFILDISGSMYGEKIKQLKSSMFTVLDDMNECDYFDIITFSHEVKYWAPLGDKTEEVGEYDQNIIPATKENTNIAIKYILGLEVYGGTDINYALLEGLKLAKFALRKEKLPAGVKSMITFLTDGNPSNGVTNHEAIKNNIKNSNAELDIQIFCIGFGDDADYNLISDISHQANSAPKRIYEGADAALQVEDFYSEISKPLLSNLKFTYKPVKQKSISKTSFKTFFKGEEYIIIGKLKNEEIHDNEVIYIKVVGEGKNGTYERTLVICLKQKEDLSIGTAGSLYTTRVPNIKYRINQRMLQLSRKKSHQTSEACLTPSLNIGGNIAKDIIPKLYAFLNIKQLMIQPDISAEDSPNHQKALSLALKYNFVTDFSSLVVIGPEQKTIRISWCGYDNLKSKENSKSRTNRRNKNKKKSKSKRNNGRNSKKRKPKRNNGRNSKKRKGKGINSKNRKGKGRNIKKRKGKGRNSKKRKGKRRNSKKRKGKGRNSKKRKGKGRNSKKRKGKGRNSQKRKGKGRNSKKRKGKGRKERKNIKKNRNKQAIDCSGNLTLFSKTYLRGDKVVLIEEDSDLEDNLFENLSVSASVSGNCCWKIFSAKNFTGASQVLSGRETYYEASSLGGLFREVSSVKRNIC